MGIMPDSIWSGEDLRNGCGYAIVTRRRAQWLAGAPSVAGGWVAAAAPLDCYGGVVDCIIRELGWSDTDDAGSYTSPYARLLDSPRTLFLAALPPCFLEAEHYPLTPEEALTIREIIEERAGYRPPHYFDAAARAEG